MKWILKSVFIIAIVAVAMIGVMVPSVFAVFPDPEKDPRDYLIRYYTEPKYQEWFDTNFPNERIEDKVGYPYKIVTDEYYVNSLFDFAIKIPANADVIENEKTTGGTSRSLVQINFDNYGVFNIHYSQKNVDDINYDDLLDWYSKYPSGGSPYIQQIKINDQSLKQNDDGMYAVRYDYVMVIAYPEDYFRENLAGLVQEKEMSKVILLYPNGDQYTFAFLTSPEKYSTGVKIFNESLDSFYSGKVKKLSSIYQAVGLDEPVAEQINEPEYVPEPETTIVSCSNDVKITPDKDIHQSGETITFTVETFDPCYVDNYRELRLYIVGYDRPNCDSCRIVESFLIKTGEPKIFQFSPEILDWSQEYYVRQGLGGVGFVELLKYDSKGNLVLNENGETQNLSFMVLPAEQDKKIISVPMCGTGTELVNGICQVIQTEEKSSNGGGCLIATATYGSEMSQQVQQLRELRDNQLLQTESGAAFMTTFNDIYYSFSPTIADMERENPLFKEAVKIAITPMLSSLSLMENANSESEVISLGLSVIALNLGMYLGVPAIVVVGIRKRI